MCRVRTLVFTFPAQLVLSDPGLILNRFFFWTQRTVNVVDERFENLTTDEVQRLIVLKETPPEGSGMSFVDSLQQRVRTGCIYLTRVPASRSPQLNCFVSLTPPPRSAAYCRRNTWRSTVFPVQSGTPPCSHLMPGAPNSVAPTGQ